MSKDAQTVIGAATRSPESYITEVASATIHHHHPFYPYLSDPPHVTKQPWLNELQQPSPIISTTYIRRHPHHCLPIYHNLHQLLVAEQIFLRLTAALEELQLYCSQDLGVRFGEVLLVAAGRQPGPTMARRVDCSFVDTVETKQESSEIRQALARSESYNRALEARIAVLETQAHRHEWQRQDADDRAMRHIMHIQALKS
ncbi:hypothetical protein Tco_1016611 [Tanacetum coccineum]|uniref:Uncharacterized protein n=1 Tax=Tanacetum coccineum TaxID=301880 RepID=A0ABQ5FP82_9ASTR